MYLGFMKFFAEQILYLVKLNTMAPTLCYVIKCNTLLTFVLINLHRQVAGSAKPVVLCYLRLCCEAPMSLPRI